MKQTALLAGLVLLAGALLLAGSGSALAHPGHAPSREPTEIPEHETTPVSDKQLVQFARVLKALEALHQQAPPLAEAGTRAEAARRQASAEKQMHRILHNQALNPQQFRHLRQRIASDSDLKQRVTTIMETLPPLSH